MHKKEAGNQQKNIFCSIPAMSSYFPYQVISDKNNRKKKPNKNQRAKQHSTPELSDASLFLFGGLLHSVHPGELPDLLVCIVLFIHPDSYSTASPPQQIHFRYPYTLHIPTFLLISGRPCFLSGFLHGCWECSFLLPACEPSHTVSPLLCTSGTPA